MAELGWRVQIMLEYQAVSLHCCIIIIYDLILVLFEFVHAAKSILLAVLIEKPKKAVFFLCFYNAFRQNAI